MNKQTEFQSTVERYQNSLDASVRDCILASPGFSDLSYTSKLDFLGKHVSGKIFISTMSLENSYKRVRAVTDRLSWGK